MLQKEAAMNWRDPELVSVFVEMVRQPNFVAHSAALFAPDPKVYAAVDGGWKAVGL